MQIWDISDAIRNKKPTYSNLRNKFDDDVRIYHEQKFISLKEILQ